MVLSRWRRHEFRRGSRPSPGYIYTPSPTLSTGPIIKIKRCSKREREKYNGQVDKFNPRHENKKKKEEKLLKAHRIEVNQHPLSCLSPFLSSLSVAFHPFLPVERIFIRIKCFIYASAAAAATYHPSIFLLLLSSSSQLLEYKRKWV